MKNATAFRWIVAGAVITAMLASVISFRADAQYGHWDPMPLKNSTWVGHGLVEQHAPGNLRLGDQDRYEVFVPLGPFVGVGEVLPDQDARNRREHDGRDRGDDSPVAHALPFIAPRRPPGALRSSPRPERSFLRRKVQSVTDVEWPNNYC